MDAASDARRMESGAWPLPHSVPVLGLARKLQLGSPASAGNTGNTAGALSFHDRVSLRQADLERAHPGVLQAEAASDAEPVRAEAPRGGPGRAPVAVRRLTTICVRNRARQQFKLLDARGARCSTGGGGPRTRRQALPVLCRWLPGPSAARRAPLRHHITARPWAAWPAGRQGRRQSGQPGFRVQAPGPGLCLQGGRQQGLVVGRGGGLGPAPGGRGQLADVHISWSVRRPSGQTSPTRLEEGAEGALGVSPPPSGGSWDVCWMTPRGQRVRQGGGRARPGRGCWRHEEQWRGAWLDLGAGSRSTPAARSSSLVAIRQADQRGRIGGLDADSGMPRPSALALPAQS